MSCTLTEAERLEGRICNDPSCKKCRGFMSKKIAEFNEWFSKVMALSNIYAGKRLIVDVLKEAWLLKDQEIERLKTENQKLRNKNKKLVTALACLE